ncbi:succinate-semialdehyde dehydrogenase (NADP(+)) [Pandoraea iniqua]|uniref:Succinate-semialdehyde dehydrogenase (NADP(+)) n=1 Tax=Pandoraea iniqua TaxID=2508288 RepID=A0A5E4VWM1_9BURK|nr:NAD-dependent succinate-semialdehyde dehydrogenase [Pandoraea iniqua]VVE15664.1 succinate-semialdehyde dehydrogenase (NADP(+)) [Pandoraea iniqua]
MIPLKNPSLFQQHAYVNGLWLPSRSGETLSVRNPATGLSIGTVPNCDDQDTRAAIKAAADALPAWSGLTAHERAARLRAWHDAMLENADDLAMIMTLEQGKPLAESKGEILYGASFVQWFAEEGIRAYGETIPAQQPGRRILVRKMPVGVCAAITPWNFPNAMITRKLAPALAAGCTVIVKPSELTPYSALALAVLAERAGIPAGVINIVTGMPQAIGGELTANPAVRKLTFTGSTPVGKLLLRQCADTVKRVSMELGGNAPVIVFDDADLDKAVTGVMLSKFRNSGQTCVCANRIYVQSGIYDEFLERLRAAVDQLRLGSGIENGVTIGPLINQAAVNKVSSHIDDAIAKGATLVTGGVSSALGEQFFEPTILSNATDDMRIAAEETFGPVAALFRFSTESEVIQRANHTPYGLAGYLFSRDLARVFRVGEALEYGMVGINTGVISSAVAPFGGVKESGLGREGSHHGIDEFIETQTLHLDIA